MQRRRYIAASPIRSASQAWAAVVALLVDTLERSPAVAVRDVRRALAPLAGLGPALIAAGHLEDDPLVLIDDALDVSIYVATGDAALSVDENLNPVPGGASATAAWVLRVPTPAPLAAAVKVAISGSDHLTTEALVNTGASADRSRAGSSPVDLAAVREVGRQP